MLFFFSPFVTLTHFFHGSGRRPSRSRACRNATNSAVRGGTVRDAAPARAEVAGQELDAQGDGVVRVGEDLAVQGVVRREADAVREAAREERRARGRALHLAVVGVEDDAAPRERLDGIPGARRILSPPP